MGSRGESIRNGFVGRKGYGDIFHYKYLSLYDTYINVPCKVHKYDVMICYDYDIVLQDDINMRKCVFYVMFVIDLLVISSTY